MRRQFVLGIVFAAGVLTISVHALQQPAAPAAGQPAPRVVEVDKLKDNLYVMRGGGGNSAVFITSTGVVVVDTKNPGWGQPLLDKIKTVTDKPITMIINTHTHGDHVSGNVEFPATVEVVTTKILPGTWPRCVPCPGSRRRLGSHLPAISSNRTTAAACRSAPSERR